MRSLGRSIKKFSADDMLVYASAVSYQVFFSLFPFIIFLLALLGFLHLKPVFDFLLQQSKTVMPRSAFGMVQNITQQIQSQASGGVMSLGAIVALWSASSAVRMAMHALNIAYDVEDRPVWKKLPLSVLYTLVLAALLIVAAGLMFMGPRLVGPILQAIGLGPLASLFLTVWTWARIPVAVLLLMVAVALIYWLFPNVSQPFRFITPGAVLAVIVWIVASLGFSFYVANFSSYSATYGALASVVVLLLYFFISAAILLLGAEINAESYRSMTDEGKDGQAESA